MFEYQGHNVKLEFNTNTLCWKSYCTNCQLHISDFFLNKKGNGKYIIEAGNEFQAEKIEQEALVKENRILISCEEFIMQTVLKKD